MRLYILKEIENIKISSVLNVIVSEPLISANVSCVCLSYFRIVSMTYDFGVSNKSFNCNCLRINNCDERLVYKNGEIFGTKGDTYTCNISPKSPDFFLSNEGGKLINLT